MSKIQQAFSYFVSMGWTPAQAAGIVANPQTESGLNPAAVGDGGAAYGIAQWHEDRQQNFAAKMGKPIQGSSFEDQLTFINWELNNTEKEAGNRLHNCTTATDAGACVSIYYERPADQAGEAVRRGALAESILQSLGGTAGGAASTSLGAAPVPPAAPAIQPQEQPMGAALAFLPIISQLLPGLITAFGNNSPQALKNANIATAVGTALQAAIPAATSLGDAVDKLANSDAATQASVQAQVLAHPDVVAQLSQLIPVLDKVATYDAATNTATIAGRASAVAAQQAATAGIVQTVVKNVAGQSWLMIVGVVIALIAAMVCKGFFPSIPDYVPMLIGPAGMIFGAVIKEMGAITSFYFDGTPASNATALARDAVEQTKAQQ